MTIPRGFSVLTVCLAALLLLSSRADGQAVPARWTIFRQATATAAWRESPVSSPDEAQARNYARQICRLSTGAPRDYAVKLVSPSGVASVEICPPDPRGQGPATAAPERLWTFAVQASAGGSWQERTDMGISGSEALARSRAGQLCRGRPPGPLLPYAVRSVSPSGVEEVTVCPTPQTARRAGQRSADDGALLAFPGRCRAEQTLLMFVDCACVDRKLAVLTEAELALPSAAITSAIGGCPNPQAVIQARYAAYCIADSVMQVKNKDAFCRCTSEGVARAYVASPNSSLDQIKNPVIRRCIRETGG